jgi:hypothetical protein
LLPTLLEVIVGLLTVTVVPEFSAQIALSSAVETSMDGLDSVFDPLV